MATKYGTQYNGAYVTEPKSQIQPGDFNGRVRLMHFDYTLDGTVLALADILKLGKIPKGARVIDAALYVQDMDGTGQVNLGWAAGASGAEVADADGFFAALDAGDANAFARIGVTSAGFCKEFSEEVDLQISMAEASTSTNTTLRGFVLYVID